MDPLSIAASAAGITAACLQVTTIIYSFANDARNIDSNVGDLLQEVQGLSRVSEVINQTWRNNPNIQFAALGDRDLWDSVRASLEDCQRTLGKLGSKLDDLQPGSFLARGFLRRPTKLLKLNMSMKEIMTFKQQLHSHHNGMQSALLMINVCLLLSSNSSQESISKVLLGLKTQIGRVEDTLQAQHNTWDDLESPDVAEDNLRIANNLRGLIRAAESIRSNASTVVGDTRSTIWDGSVMGDPLSDEQYGNIRDWIPPLSGTMEEDEQSEHLETSSNPLIISSNANGGDNSDEDSEDSDIEHHLTKRYQELAFSSLEKKNYPRAEQFYRRVIQRNEDNEAVAPDELRRMRIILSYVCGLQEKWDEVEEILVPIAMAKGTPETMAFHGLHALALTHLGNGKHDLAIKYCKRAVGGHRKFGGKTSTPYIGSMALLAQIYDYKSDPTAAEVARSFLPANYSYNEEQSAAQYLESVIIDMISTLRGSPSLSNIASIDVRSLTPTPSPLSHGRSNSTGSFLTETATSASEKRTEPFVPELGSTISTISVAEFPRCTPIIELLVSPSPPSTAWRTKSSDENTDIVEDPQLNPPNSPASLLYSGEEVFAEDYLPERSIQELEGDCKFESHSCTAARMLDLSEILTTGFSSLSNDSHHWPKKPKSSIAQGTSPWLQPTWSGMSFKDYNLDPREPLTVGLHLDSKQPAFAVAFQMDKPQLLVEVRGSETSRLKVSPYLVFDGWGEESTSWAQVDFSNPFAMLVNEKGKVNASGIPIIGKRSILDLLTLYLSKIEQVIQLNMKNLFRDPISNNYGQTAPGYSFVIPHGWPEFGMEAFSIAAKAAKLNGRSGSLTFISEIEATVLYQVDEGNFSLDDGDIILVINGGDDSLNLASYRVQSTDQYLVRLTKPSGGHFGFDTVKQSFEKLITSKTNVIRIADFLSAFVIEKVYSSCLKAFDDWIRMEFCNNGQNWNIEVSPEIDYTFVEVGMEEGYIALSNEEVLSCFEPVSRGLLELVKREVLTIWNLGETIKYVLVRGCLGGNPYIAEQLRQTFPPSHQSRVTFVTDAEAISAKGAVLAARNTTTDVRHSPFKKFRMANTPLGISKFAYLISTPLNFDRIIHLQHLRLSCLDGVDRVADSATLVLAADSPLFEHETVKINIERQVPLEGELIVRDEIYSWQIGVLPDSAFSMNNYYWATSVHYQPKVMATVITDLSRYRGPKENCVKICKGQDGSCYRSVSYELTVTVEMSHGPDPGPELRVISEVHGYFSRSEVGSASIPIEIRK